MQKHLLVAVFAAGSVLALAGCSTPSTTGPGSTAGTPVLAAAFAATDSVPVSADTNPAVITTVGTGKVKGTPDLMTISLGVQTQAATATEALSQNNTVATDVIAVIKGSGVDPADLQTSDLNLSPTYDDKGKITGYQVTNSVTAILRDIASAGSLIDAVGQKAGDAVRVQQLGFSIDDDSALRATARADAVTQARAQAGQLAAAAGVELGAVRSITEVGSATPKQYYQAASMDAAAASVPVEAGSQEPSVSVQVVYDVTQ